MVAAGVPCVWAMLHPDCFGGVILFCYAIIRKDVLAYAVILCWAMLFCDFFCFLPYRVILPAEPSDPACHGRGSGVDNIVGFLVALVFYCCTQSPLSCPSLYHLMAFSSPRFLSGAWVPKILF